MEINEILRQFAESPGMPVEAIEAARARREECVPAFLQVVEDAMTGKMATSDVDSPIFLVFHMLGEWREKTACGPLLRMLQCDPERVEKWLGDALTETAGRVLAGVFDGDPVPLREAILNPKANEWARDAVFDAFANLARAGAIDLDDAKGFLRDCFTELQPRAEHPVWTGWVGAVAELGLKELEPLVREAFDLGFIDPIFMGFDEFESDLDYAVRTGDEAAPPLRAFGDTVDELGWWATFSGEEEDEDLDTLEDLDLEADSDLWGDGIATRLVDEIARAPVENPDRHIGRNDPCPCGSGRKFKKCCMA